MLVEKNPKHGTLLFGRFKARFFFIIGIVLLALILLYIYLNGASSNNQLSGQGNNVAVPQAGKNVNSSWSIQLSYYNASVSGDGVSKVNIPFTIFRGVGEPLTTPVQVQARTNVGSAVTTCSAPSVCNVAYTAPETVKGETAQITIDAGGVTQNVSIEITPDEVASISIDPTPVVWFLSSSSGLLYAPNVSGHYIASYRFMGYPDQTTVWQQSFATVTVHAFNKYGVPVNNAVINFSDSVGTFSNSSCITSLNESSPVYNDSCTVNYTPVAEVNNSTIRVSSYDVSSYISVNIVSTPISNLGNLS